MSIWKVFPVQTHTLDIGHLESEDGLQSEYSLLVNAQKVLFLSISSFNLKTLIPIVTLKCAGHYSLTPCSLEKGSSEKPLISLVEHQF